MKKQVTILVFLLITFFGYSQSEVVYYQNFETWSNGVPTNWGGPGTNIITSNIVPNQYQLGPTNTSAKFFANPTGITYITTPQFTVDNNFYYYIYYKFRTNCLDTTVGYDQVLNTISQIGGNAFNITLASDSTQWYEQMIPYQPDILHLDAELRFKITPNFWLELDEVYIYKTKSQDTLNINNIGALIHSNGNFFNKDNVLSGFNFPKNSPKATIYCSNLWIGGYDINEQLHLAAQKFPVDGFSIGPKIDYSFGPISNDTSIQYNLLYNKVWKINKSDIDYHIAHYNDINYTIPPSISQWPAHGRMDQGEMWILAPFVDVNNDNMYNPENGDYPKIRGDQAIFFMMNDQKLLHGSGGQKLGVQINGMAYSYDAPNDTFLNNTVFMHFDIYNRSTFDYHDMYIGTFTDFEIGYADDDYVGCDTIRNMCYGYNGIIIDGSGQNNHYGANPPIQGLVSLNNPMSGFSSINNSNSISTGDPHTASEYYYYLTGRFKDGTPVQYGGNGYQTGTWNTPYMYSGNPMDLSNNSWTEINVENAPFDRRGIMASGPFTLNAGQNLYYDIAFPVIMTTNNEYMNITDLQAMVDSIQNFYNSMNYVVDTTNTQVDEYLNTIDCKVYPNPNSGEFKIIFSELPVNGTIEFYNTLGQLIQVNPIQNQIETYDLNPQTGMVFYSVFSENKILYRGKMIVK